MTDEEIMKLAERFGIDEPAMVLFGRGDVIDFARAILQAAIPLPECVCGQPFALGVVHRKDGPCYVASAEQEGEWRGSLAQIIWDIPIPEGTKQFQHGFVSAKESILQALRDAGLDRPASAAPQDTKREITEAAAALTLEINDFDEDALHERMMRQVRRIASAIDKIPASAAPQEDIPRIIAFIERLDKRLEASGYSHAQRLEITGILMSNKVEDATATAPHQLKG